MYNSTNMKLISSCQLIESQNSSSSVQCNNDLLSSHKYKIHPICSSPRQKGLTSRIYTLLNHRTMELIYVLGKRLNKPPRRLNSRQRKQIYPHKRLTFSHYRLFSSKWYFDKRVYFIAWLCSALNNCTEYRREHKLKFNKPLNPFRFTEYEAI